MRQLLLTILCTPVCCAQHDELICAVVGTGTVAEESGEGAGGGEAAEGRGGDGSGGDNNSGCGVAEEGRRSVLRILHSADQTNPSCLLPRRCSSYFLQSVSRAVKEYSCCLIFVYSSDSTFRSQPIL
jgi:hypothetical protein